MKELIIKWYEREKTKMTSMSKSERFEYILEYYKIQILIALVVIALLIWLPYHFMFDHSECIFNCALVNISISDSRDIELANQFDEYLELNTRKAHTYFDSTYNIAYPGVSNDGADTSFYEKFFLNLSVNTLDAVIMPESYFEYCNSLNYTFYDVAEVLSGEQLETYAGYFVIGKVKDETDGETEDGIADGAEYKVSDEVYGGVEYTCGIDISALAPEFLEKEKIVLLEFHQDERLILAFPYGGGNLERCREFLEMVSKR